MKQNFINMEIHEKLCDKTVGGDFKLLKFIGKLLGDGYSINSTDEYGHTLLHFAAMQSRVKSIRFLLEYGVPVDVRDISGRTPLMDAATHGSIEACEILLEDGADVNARNCEGKSVHEVATTTTNNDDVLEYLTAKGAR
jgi:ankyrin repeat protein